jgi:hypothetical protein
MTAAANVADTSRVAKNTEENSGVTLEMVNVAS